MDPRNDEPFDREAWRKLLGTDTGAPTRDMDRRILAESRRTLAPRVARWWLPASLAASLLLAVLLVQRQLAVAPAPVSESDVELPPAQDRYYDLSPPPAVDLPAEGSAVTQTPAAEVPAARFEMPMTLPPPAEEAPAAAPVVAAPEPALQEMFVTGSRASEAKSAADQSEAALAPPPPAASAVSSRMIGNLSAERENATTLRPAEEWYAEIVKLRAAGHAKEADEELAQFKITYPDWLEMEHKKDP